MSTLATLLPASARVEARVAPSRAGNTERVLAAAALLLFAGGVVPLATGHGGNDGSDPLGLAVQAAVCLAGMGMLLKAPGGVFRAVERLDPWILALLAVIVVSTAWSVDPLLTARKAGAVLGVTIFGLYLASRWSLSEQVWLVAQALGVAAVLSALTAVLLPRYGLQPGSEEWRGIFLQKNVLARLMALGLLAGALCLCAPTAAATRRWWAGAAALACGLVLLKSGSIFAVGSALGIGSAVAAVLIHRVPFPVRHGLVVAGSTVLSSGVAFIWVNRGDLLAAVGKDISLTGRIPLWQATWDAVSHRPLEGFGYGAFWQGWDPPSTQVLLRNPWGPPHAHNGVLESMLGIGVVGTVLWLIALGVCFARALRHARARHSSLAVWPVGLLIIVVAYNLTEVTTTTNAFFWSLVVAVSTLLRRPRSSAEP